MILRSNIRCLFPPNSFVLPVEKYRVLNCSKPPFGWAGVEHSLDFPTSNRFGTHFYLRG
jgi:hypothetical protein